MLNYIAAQVVFFALRSAGPPRGRAAPRRSRRASCRSSMSRLIIDAARRSGWTTASWSPCSWRWRSRALLFRTTKGFELRAAGFNLTAARYAGMSAGGSMMLAMALSGALAGMGGGFMVIGTVGQLSLDLSGGIGFTAIALALLAGLRPSGVVARRAPVRRADDRRQADGHPVRDPVRPAGLHHGPGHHVRGRPGPDPLDLAHQGRQAGTRTGRVRASRRRPNDARRPTPSRRPAKALPPARPCAAPGSAAPSSPCSVSWRSSLASGSFGTPGRLLVLDQRTGRRERSRWRPRSGCSGSSPASASAVVGDAAAGARRRRSAWRPLAAVPDRAVDRGAARQLSSPGKPANLTGVLGGEPRARGADHAWARWPGSCPSGAGCSTSPSRARCSSARASHRSSASLTFLATGNGPVSAIVGVVSGDDRRRWHRPPARLAGHPPQGGSDHRRARSSISAPIGITNFMFLRILSHNTELNTPPNDRGDALADPGRHPGPRADPVRRQALRVRRLHHGHRPDLHVLFRTRWGLRLRASGEKPAAAGTVGINVIAIRYRALLLAGLICRSRGFVPVALDGRQLPDGDDRRQGLHRACRDDLRRLASGRGVPRGPRLRVRRLGPDRCLSSLGVDVPPQLLSSVPYVVTIIVVAGVVGRVRGPAAAGQPYEQG